MGSYFSAKWWMGLQEASPSRSRTWRKLPRHLRILAAHFHARNNSPQLLPPRAPLFPVLSLFLYSCDKFQPSGYFIVQTCTHIIIQASAFGLFLQGEAHSFHVPPIALQFVSSTPAHSLTAADHVPPFSSHLPSASSSVPPAAPPTAPPVFVSVVVALPTVVVAFPAAFCA